MKKTMYLHEIIQAIQTAPNMVEISCLLSEVKRYYLNEYANKIERPAGTNYTVWVSKALKFYGIEINRAERMAFETIPARFYQTLMYQKLKTQKQIA